MKHAKELGVEVVPSLNLVYTKEKGYVTEEEAKEAKLKAVKLSGTEFRRKLRAGEEIPEWFAFKSVVDVLRKSVQSEPQ
jgi:sulfate adenylyltransferase